MIKKNRPVYLCGFMGCGKSRIGREFAKRSGMTFADLDRYIVEHEGMKIPEIFEKYGESRFRDLESELILTIGKEGNTIVSCGGGVVVRPENIEYMKKNGRVFYLKTSPETVYNRVKDSTNRPILNGNMNVEYIAGLMEKRRALYEGAADITITTDGKSVDEITDEIIIAI